MNTTVYCIHLKEALHEHWAVMHSPQGGTSLTPGHNVFTSRRAFTKEGLMSTRVYRIRLMEGLYAPGLMYSPQGKIS